MDLPKYGFASSPLSPHKSRTISAPTSPFLQFRPPQISTAKRLEDARIIQRCLVYIINLPSSAASEPLLTSQLYFGKYGQITKVHLSPGHQNQPDITYAAYLTYSTEEQAAVCIRACHDFVLDGKKLTLTFGTTKYCSNFLKNSRCLKPNCVFLHCMATEADTVFRDEMNSNKHIQPQDCLIDKLKVMISDPLPPSKLPDFRVIRDRAISDIVSTHIPAPNRPRVYSRDFPQSRYNFVIDSQEEIIEMPKIVNILRNLASPHKESAVVSQKDIEEMMLPESPLKWFVDVMEVQQDEKTQTAIMIKKQRSSL